MSIKGLCTKLFQPARVATPLHVRPFHQQKFLLSPPTGHNDTIKVITSIYERDKNALAELAKKFRDPEHELPDHVQEIVCAYRILNPDETLRTDIAHFISSLSPKS